MRCTSSPCRTQRGSRNATLGLEEGLIALRLFPRADRIPSLVRIQVQLELGRLVGETSSECHRHIGPVRHAGRKARSTTSPTTTVSSTARFRNQHLAGLLRRGTGEAAGPHRILPPSEQATLWLAGCVRILGHWSGNDGNSPFGPQVSFPQLRPVRRSFTILLEGFLLREFRSEFLAGSRRPMQR
jgi:hypothetical protein